MGIIIDRDLELHFRCDLCDQPIETLTTGVFLHWNYDQSLTEYINQFIAVHRPTTGEQAYDCLKAWLETYPGDWATIDLMTFFTQIGTRYPQDWQRIAELVAKRVDTGRNQE